MAQTYREAIQKLQEQIDAVYDDVGWLRDCAAQNEKDTWNRLRTLTREAYHELSQLDNRLPDDRAHMLLSAEVSAK